MELATTLKGQTVQNYVREVGINPNYWYPVGWADQLATGQIMPVMVWQQAIAIYRDGAGELHAVEDACPHKGVALHKGDVIDNHLACPYHGWEFDPQGQCVRIPYFPPEQKLPCANVKTYPVQEQYHLIWVFPGDAALAPDTPLPDVPEYSQPEYLMIPITGKFKSHFSISNENTMDVFHGYLHRNLQGWFDPMLINLRETENSVHAEYRVSYKGGLSQFLGLSDQSGVTTRVISVTYTYPHYHNSLEGISSLYLMRLPVSPTETQSFSLMFLKVRLPQWILQFIRLRLAGFIRKFLFMKFLDQDIEMMESEQRTYTANPHRRYVEINPAIIALQRVIVRQYEKFMQQSSQSSQTQTHKDHFKESMIENAIASKQFGQ